MMKTGSFLAGLLGVSMASVQAVAQPAVLPPAPLAPGPVPVMTGAMRYVQIGPPNGVAVVEIPGEGRRAVRLNGLGIPYTLPVEVPWHEGPLLPGETLEQRANLALIISGIVGFVGGYSLGSSLGSLLSLGAEEPATWWYVPVIGSWVQLAEGTSQPVVAVVSGVVQAAGLAVLACGLAFPRRRILRPVFLYAPGAGGWALGPSLGAAPGLALMGQF